MIKEQNYWVLRSAMKTKHQLSRVHTGPSTIMILTYDITYVQLQNIHMATHTFDTTTHCNQIWTMQKKFSEVSHTLRLD